MSTLLQRRTRIPAGARLVNRYRQGTEGISKNVQFLLGTEPLWAIPVTWTRTYASLFMAALGLTSVQIGWIASLVLIVQMVGAPFGGYLADRFGRKRLLTVVDTLSWFVPPLIWMMSQNVLYFVIAAMFNGLNVLVWPAWNCLLVEDTVPRRRSTVFAGFQLVVLGAGLFSPIAGAIVAGNDVIGGTRILYAITAASVGTMILLRGLFLRETSVGKTLTEEFKDVKLSQYLTGYKVVLGKGVKNRTLIALFFLSFINTAYMTVWNTYSALYMTHVSGLRLSPEFVAIWPTFSSLIMILTLVFVVPKVKPEKLPKWLILSSALMVIGLGTFIMTPAGSPYSVIAISAVVLSVGMALINPVRDTFMANVMEDKDRAALLSGMNLASMILIIPLTPIAGKMFDLNPKAPLIMLLGMLAIGAFISVFLRREKPVSPEAA